MIDSVHLAEEHEIARVSRNKWQYTEQAEQVSI